VNALKVGGDNGCHRIRWCVPRVAHPLRRDCHAVMPGCLIAFRIDGKARRTRHAEDRTMKLAMTRLRSLVRDDSGQDLLEYALLITLIALACVVAVKAAGTSMAAIFTAIAAAIPLPA
jgi:pilus assembly protein Flp/PilA